MVMGEKPQVMVVDDDLAMCSFLRTFLGARGYSAVTVTNADEAVPRFHAERPAAVLLDVVMPGSMDGLAALAAFKKIDRDVPIIVISGQGRTNTVVQAMKLGATDFVCKPFEDAELEMLLGNALKQRQLSREVANLREQLKEQSKYTMLFGNSEKMLEVRDLIHQVSDTDVTVLIRGEFARLGGKSDVHVDVRVITATNRDLEFAVAAGQFREDLYFRLNVVTINLPPLRERREEIPLLVDHFLKKYSVQYNKPVTAISTDLAREFMQYDWPGNVRQLENLIKRMVILGSETQIVGELRQSSAHFSFRSQAF